MIEAPWDEGGVRQARAALQNPLLELLRQGLRAVDATGSSLAGIRQEDNPMDGADDSAGAGLPAVLARLSSVLVLLGMAVPSWHEMTPAQIARFLLTWELQLQDEPTVPAAGSTARDVQVSESCALTLRQAGRSLRLVCSEALSAAYDQLASPRQSEHGTRVMVLTQTVDALGRLWLLQAHLPQVLDSGVAGAGTRLILLALVTARRELKGLRFAGRVAGQESLDPILRRVLQQLGQNLQGPEVETEPYDDLGTDCLAHGIQRQALLQDSLVDAGSRSELSCCFRQELVSSLERLRAEWQALSAKPGLRYLCGWHCAWVSRLTTAALICADVPRYDLLEEWRQLLCWQFERSEPLRQHDLQLFDEVCAALVTGAAGPEAPDDGMTVDTGMLETRLAAALCARAVSTGVVSAQVPVGLAQNIRALLTACAQIRAGRGLPVSALPSRRLLVELRLLTAGARTLRVYRVEALSSALTEVHLMLAGAGDAVLAPDRLALLAEAHAQLCGCLNCAAAHQEVPDCRELIASLYSWLDTGMADAATRSPAQPARVAPKAEESHAVCFQREAVALAEAIDQRILELAGPTATDAEIPLCPQLLSLLHTLKGSALQFDCVGIADLCHGLERLLLLKHTHDRSATQGEVTSPSAELLSYARDLRGAIDELGRGEAIGSGMPVALPVDGPSLPISAQTLTRLAGLVEQLGHCSRSMREVLLTMELPDVNAPRMGVLRDLLAEQERHAVELAEEIAGSRTVCFDRLSSRLQRLAARHANELDRQVRLQVQGGELRLDRLLLEQLVAPLEHLLRNAIDHGIEPVAERRAASKPDCGIITLRVAAGAGQGSQLQIELTDDGRGIKTGISGSFTEEDGLQQLFEVGFSTRARVTVEGGHGLGLAAVKDAIAALKGTIRVSSRPGAGTCFHIALPV